MKFTLSVLMFITLLYVSAISQSSGGDSGSGILTGEDSRSNTEDTGLAILSKPRPGYTEEARKELVGGKVLLRVTFLATGKIGAISVIEWLPFELTEKSIAAAKKIRFRPATRNGVAINFLKIVQFNFSIIFNSSDSAIVSPVKITSRSYAVRPTGKDLRKRSGKVEVTAILTSTGEVQIVEVRSKLPEAFKEAAVTAAGNLKFEPAVHESGRKVSVYYLFEYHFPSIK
ncbi:MAG TPA: energy transducer TonB [Aridibacter sp.]|nr:energy transducer TonB [Aridibacter sp.]